MVPKDKGHGLMLSSFQCRDLGYAPAISAEQFAAVNAERQGAVRHLSPSSRKIGNKYVDEAAAVAVHGKAEKSPLTESPWSREFQFGSNYDGYWTYEHLVTQVEDLADVLQVLHPCVQVLMMFDHSSGHDKKRPDGLNATSMNKEFGGKQPKMRETKIEEEDCYLGSFPRILEVGMLQSLVFSDTDEGPYWLSVDERAKQKFDFQVTDEMKTRKLNKAELIVKLKEANMNWHGNMESLSKLATNHGIPLDVKEPLLKHGWLNKPKGLLQILWERGFIHPLKTNKEDHVVDDKTGT
jgi:hypothetical protein